jgi:hypothetical protein
MQCRRRRAAAASDVGDTDGAARDHQSRASASDSVCDATLTAQVLPPLYDARQQVAAE